MALYRIQNSLQDVSGLARDRFVNTIYVSTIAPLPDVDNNLLAINGKVRDFYVSMTAWWSLQIKQTAAVHTVKAYDMAVAPGLRVPLGVVNYAIPVAGSSASPMPAEVAFAVTLEANPRPGVAPMSTRGRIFLGPLNTLTAGGEGVGQSGRPTSTFRDGVRAAVGTMITAINAIGGSSVAIASTRQGKVALAPGNRQAYPVINVSTDDAWDTQRSRGNRPTARTRLNVVTGATTPRSW
jgi:hypothetical protein